MKITQRLLQYISEVIEEKTDVPCYAIISDNTKTTPRIDITINTESDHEACINAKDVNINIELKYNVNDGLNEILQSDIENLLLDSLSVKTFINAKGDMILDWFKVVKSDVESKDGLIVVSWEVETIIQ